MAADTVIAGVGEAPDAATLGAKLVTSSSGTILAHQFSKVTNIPGVFACGDAVSGPATVIEAIATGRQAAEGVDRFLRGENLDYEEPESRKIPIEDVEVERFRKRARRTGGRLSTAERAGFAEVETGFSELNGLAEADRCFQCGLFPRKPAVPEEHQQS